MNYKSWLSRFIAVASVMAILTSSILGFNLQVQALPILTPEAREYDVDQTTNQVEQQTEQLQEKGAAQAQETRKAIEKTKDEVVEKLNLDEPLPSDTKKFFRQLKGEEGIYNTNNPD